jgi:hypothetical protein
MDEMMPPILSMAKVAAPRTADPMSTCGAFFGKRLPRDKCGATSHIMGYGKSNYEDDIERLVMHKQST